MKLIIYIRFPSEDKNPNEALQLSFLCVFSAQVAAVLTAAGRMQQIVAVVAAPVLSGQAG